MSDLAAYIKLIRLLVLLSSAFSPTLPVQGLSTNGKEMAPVIRVIRVIRFIGVFSAPRDIDR